MRTKSVLKLSVSIVSYNTKELLRRNLKSIFKFTKGLSFEVIVVDNASTDGSAEMVQNEFPQVVLISNKTNRWYTGANNQALKIAKGKYFLILNSDIFLKANIFKIMVDFVEKNPRVGAVEPAQRYEDGRVAQTSSRHNYLWFDWLELTWLGSKLKFLFTPWLNRFRLKNTDRLETYEADVISDAAMLIKTKLLKKIGGYDTKFKLYYTENDLCRRMQRLGLKTIHLGKAIVWHRVSASTDKAGWRVIGPVYAADAKQYYFKYHSKLSGLWLYWWLKFDNFLFSHKPTVMWLSLVIIATVLRFYRLPELMTFIGDQGRDYLAARDMVLTGVWPLTGIPSSIPWLHQGVLFIWLTALSFKLGGFSPLVPAVMTAVMGVISVYLLYRLSKNWWAGLLLATAPLSVIHSRLPYHLSPISLVAIGYLWSLTINSAGWGIFMTSLLLQFELSNLPLVFLTLFWFRMDLKKLLRWSPVGLLPFLPKIIYDLTHGFTQTIGLAAWTGYRLTRLGQYGNATANIFDYWTKFSAWGSPLLAAVVGIWLLLTIRKQPKVLSLTLLFLLVGYFVHGSPSEGYFPVLFPVWAWFLANAAVKRWAKVLLLGLVIFNTVNLFANNFYTYGPTLKDRLWLVDVLPQSFKLENFSGNPSWSAYLDNYRYLIWWRGKDNQAETGPVYSIYDGPAADFVQPPQTTVYHFGNQKLIKYE